jgi:hypothetical protein
MKYKKHVNQLMQYIQAWTWCQDEGNPNQGQGQTASITGSKLCSKDAQKYGTSRTNE